MPTTTGTRSAGQGQDQRVVLVLDDRQGRRGVPAQRLDVLGEVLADAERAAGAGEQHRPHRLVGGDGRRTAASSAQERWESAGPAG